MTDLRLALRLVMGGGRSGAIRFLMMGVGLTIAMASVMLVAQIPGIISARADVLTERAPVLAAGNRNAVAFDYFVTPASWEGHVMERIFVAGEADTTPPPGLDRFPRPGEVALSPAARELLSDPGFSALVPGDPVQSIQPHGLTGPDELVAYVGVGPESLDNPSRGVGWGLPRGTFAEGAEQFKSVSIELAVLILPPVLIFVMACGRLSGATRRRRYAALRLVGTSRRTLQRVAFLETGAAVLFGLGGGVVSYAIVNAPIGRSGITGLSWYPDQARVGGTTVFILVATAAIAARCAAFVSGRRAAVDPVLERRTQEDGPPRWWMLVPLFLGLGLLIPWLPSSEAVQGGSTGEVVLLSGAVLSCVGMLLAARWLVTSVARRLADSRVPLGIRLGANRLVSDSSSAVRIMAGLAVLLIVASVGAGLTISAEQNASSALRPIRAHVYGNEVVPTQRTEVKRLGETGQAWITVASKVKFDQSPDDQSLDWAIEHIGVRMLVASCEDAVELLRTSLPTCADGELFRLRTPISHLVLPAGRDITFSREGEPITVTTPSREIVSTSKSQVGLTSQLLYTGDGPPGGWIDDSTFYFALPPGLESLDEFSTRLAQVAPTATVNASLDLSAVASFRVHRSAIRMGAWLGFGLGVLAALISLVDRNLERRRLVVELVTLGTPKRVVRTAQVAFAVVPFAVLGAIAVPVGFVIANAIGAADTGRRQWLWEPLTDAAPLLLIGLVAAALSGLIVVGMTPRAEDLRHE